MKRYSIFLARFALVPMISGTFVVSMNGRASLIEWAHVVTGFATLYLIFFLLLLSAKHREVRLPAALALGVGLLEAIPGVPRLHAVVSPVLFTILVWASTLLPSPRTSWRIFILPGLVLPPIVFGVGYRHQTSGIVPHITAAMLAAGTLLIFCVTLNQKDAIDARLRALANLTIAAVLFQIVAGIATLVIRVLDLDSGLALGLARIAHITGAAPLLAVTTMLAMQYRRVSQSEAAAAAPLPAPLAAP